LPARGLGVSSFSVAPATSVVSATAATTARELSQLHVARLAAHTNSAASGGQLPSHCHWSCPASSGIAADHAKYGETPGRHPAPTHSQQQNGTWDETGRGDILACGRGSLPPRRSRPGTNRHEIDAATSGLMAVRALEKAQPRRMNRWWRNTPPSARFIRGRAPRRRTAEWITSRTPADGRVAVNHIWAISTPLVASLRFRSQGARRRILNFSTGSPPS
jgi:hypothetical protein